MHDQVIKNKNVFLFIRSLINLGCILLIIIEQVVTRHVDIFWNVDFDSQTLSGEAVLQFDIVAKEIESIVRYFETL